MTDDHLSLDQLAELDEGSAPPERDSAARAHLADCAQCRADAESITATRTVLANLPAVTMPPEVHARLDRALADEAAGSARSATIVPNVVSLRRRRFGRPTMAASAAAAAVVLVLGAIVVAAVDHHGSAGGSDDAAPSGSTLGTLVPGAEVPNNQVGTPNFPTATTDTTYTAASLPTQVSALLHTATGSGSSALTATTAPSSADSAPPVASPTTSNGKATNRPSGKGGKAKGGKGTKGKPRPSGQPLSSSGFQAAGGSADNLAALPGSLLAFAADRAKVLQCAETMSPSLGTFPVAVDFARWSAPASGTSPALNAVPSVILVYPYSGNTYRVYVVAPSCDPSSVRLYKEVTL